MQLPKCPPFDHLDRMTDSTGLIQHAIYSIPRRESGYTTDDNARALRLCASLWNEHPDERLLNRTAGYLSFLEHARRPLGGFHNFLGYQRNWLDAGGTEDCQGQAVLALAEVLCSQLPDGYRALARELIDGVSPVLAEVRSLRSQAYVIQAWALAWRAGVESTTHPLDDIARLAADRLVDCYDRSQRANWQWFESRMTYANAVLPHALFDAAERWPEGPYLSVATSSFDFLVAMTTSNDVFWPVGNRDWFSQGEAMSRYDQQPVEASTMAAAALAAWRSRSDDSYLDVFHRAHGWFHGQNSLRQPLADVSNGACCDALQPTHINRNQGAESTLAYLWTELLASRLQRHSATRANIGLAGEIDFERELPDHQAPRSL